ncbi:MAG: envelope biogenesis factor ElyC [Deltaproteobacteria bacterium]|nr:envelope biogenesis factor ElyC [Deltaproteobacteria bacterium]
MPELIFVIAKGFSSLLSPLPFLILLLAIGMVLLWWSKRGRAGKIAVTGATLLLVLLSYGFISTALLKPLENAYPPYQATASDRSSVKWVVVLGGGHVSSAYIPVTSQLSGASLFRLTEGVRIHRELPGSKMVLAGGAVFDTVPEVEISGRIVQIMGVKPSDLVLEKKSKDTEEQAVYVKNIVGHDRFVLVTSASHMPRSMALFRKVGLNPIPAPAHYRVIEKRNSAPGDYFPSTGNLDMAGSAIYEYLCLCWSRLRGRI